METKITTVWEQGGMGNSEVSQTQYYPLIIIIARERFYLIGKIIPETYSPVKHPSSKNFLTCQDHQVGYLRTVPPAPGAGS
jgi:hypothetical protein